MGFFREVELGVSFAPFSAFREHFGFVPSLFRCQSLLPRLIEAETGLRSVDPLQRPVSFAPAEGALASGVGASKSQRVSRDRALSDAVSARRTRRNSSINCSATTATTDLPAAEVALLRVRCLSSARMARPFRGTNVTEVNRMGGQTKSSIEVVLVVAWAKFISCSVRQAWAPLPILKLCRFPPARRLTRRPVRF